MASLLLTVDNESPLVEYDPPGAWSYHNIDTDPSTDQFGANLFHRMTFSKTQNPEATMTFAFEGVDVTIYGSRNTGHGDFTVTIDGQSYTGHGAGTPTLQTPVFSANKSLSPGKHTMTISNQGDSTFVIDYLTWVSNVNSNKTGFPFMTVVDDTDSAFQYPKGNWSSPADVNLFYNITGHSTPELGSTVTLTFAGVYTSCPDNGLYSVQLDNGPLEKYSALTKTRGVKSLLYYGSNIGEGNHSIAIVNGGNSHLEVDYANIYTLSLDSLALPAGTIAGISVAAASAVILMFLAGYFLGLRRQRKKISQQQNEHAIESPFALQSSKTDSFGNDPTRVSPFPFFMPDNTKTAYQIHSAQFKFPLDNLDNASIVRTSTLRSETAASTLIAENGSTVHPHTPRGAQFRRKPGRARGARNFGTKQASTETPREESEYDAASETGSIRSGATSTLYAP
ncbi:hypothetical protein C0992_009694 [Termitomyces sp. T32_za158]|nr:hypothetical protein C0992_009694 [Termitomyces sp. T32_za158]